MEAHLGLLLTPELCAQWQQQARAASSVPLLAPDDANTNICQAAYRSLVETGKDRYLMRQQQQEGQDSLDWHRIRWVVACVCLKSGGDGDDDEHDDAGRPDSTEGLAQEAMRSLNPVERRVVRTLLCAISQAALQK